VKTGSIRIVVAVSRAQPELFADLAALSTRGRAERVRTLATLGVLAAKGTVIAEERHPVERQVERCVEREEPEQKPSNEEHIHASMARKFAKNMEGI